MPASGPVTDRRATERRRSSQILCDLSSQPAHVLHQPPPSWEVLPDMALNMHVGARVTALDSAQLSAPYLDCTVLAQVKRSNRRTPRSAYKPTVAQVSFDAQDRGL